MFHFFFLKDRISFLAHAGLGCTNKSPFYFCLPSVGTAGMSHNAQFLKYSVDLAQNGEGVRTQSPNSLSAHHRPRGWGCCLSICLPSRKTTTPLPTVIVLKRITPPLPPHTHMAERGGRAKRSWPAGLGDFFTRPCFTWFNTKQLHQMLFPPRTHLQLHLSQSLILPTVETSSGTKWEQTRVLELRNLNWGGWGWGR